MRYAGNRLLSQEATAVWQQPSAKGWSHTPANSAGRFSGSEGDLGASSSSAAGEACPGLYQRAPLPAEPSAKTPTHRDLREGRGSNAKTDTCLKYSCNILSESTGGRNLPFPRFPVAPLLLTTLGMGAFPGIYKWPTQRDKPVAKPP